MALTSTSDNALNSYLQTYTTNIYARGVSAIRMSWVKDIPVRKPRHVAV